METLPCQPVKMLHQYYVIFQYLRVYGCEVFCEDECWHMQGVFRFNCADSLDRTNVASYYSAFQVLLEQCRILGLQVCRSTAALMKLCH
jgi:hypothetical protein